MTEANEYQGNGIVPGRAQNVVRLGRQEYGVIPQPHAVILRKLPGLMTGLQSLEGEDLDSGEAIITALGGRVYDALKIFIPDLMPEYMFGGFPSEEAQKSNSFDEEYAIREAPTLPEVFHAFDVAFAVNGGKRLKDLLGNALGPEMSRAVRSFIVARMRASLSEMYANSPAEAGGSEASTSSGASDPTPNELVNAA